ncbi:MAG TPA: hypothetical protein VLG27_04525 [Candidatus Saccharimonadia bacterium]|nr:hypothetical protein [Candidatus Saccharimonadia bacterium]
MSTKTKKPSTPEKIEQAAGRVGIVLLAGAATLGLLDMPNQPEKRVVLPSRPVFAFAENNFESENVNPIRREKEDTETHYVSYSVVQRTAPRSGKH